MQSVRAVGGQGAGQADHALAIAATDDAAELLLLVTLLVVRTGRAALAGCHASVRDRIARQPEAAAYEQSVRRGRRILAIVEHAGLTLRSETLTRAVQL